MSQAAGATPWKRLDGARPLLAWRDTELAAIAQVVRSLLQPWREAWGLSGEDPPVHCMPATATDHAMPWGAGYKVGEGAAWLALTPAFEAQLARELWGDEKNSPLALQVLGACREDLVAHLIARLGITAPAAMPAPARTTATWSGEVAVGFAQGARLLLDGAAVRSIVGAETTAGARAVAAAARPRLASIPAAAAGMRLMLAARLADCELDVASLQDLCVGDIVPLLHRLDEPLQVRDAAGQLVFGGFLARQGQRKALELAPPLTPGAQRA